MLDCEVNSSLDIKNMNKNEEAIVVEAKPVPREREVILNEYKECASTIGDLSYRSKCLESDMQRIYKRMVELNVEAEAGKVLKVAPQAPESVL